MGNAEDKVSKFYNTVGWESQETITEDAKRWEDLREFVGVYVSKCRLRVLRHIPDHGVNILDMASGPIQYKEYLEYSKHYEHRYCVDLSLPALLEAKRKIGNHGVFLHGSFFNIPLEDDFFDCIVSLHTIYHIDKNKQEEAVRKLIRIAKPGKPVIIVYSNPKTITSFLKRPFRMAYNLYLALIKRDESKYEKQQDLYFHQHPNEWWARFNDSASIKIFPWRSFRSDDQKRLIPNNRIGMAMLTVLFKLEDRFPNYFAKHFQYPMIILTKRQPGDGRSIVG